MEESEDMAVGEFENHPADENWWVQVQIVLPFHFRGEVLQLAHETPFAGHLGVKKTQAHLLKQFYWPTVCRDVVHFCGSCYTCKIAGKAGHSLLIAPLQLTLVVEAPFSQAIIDCIGPLPRTKKGHEYLLTIMDVTTRFPEAVPVHSICASLRRCNPIMEPTLLLGCSSVMCELRITQVLSSAYHPES